MLYYFKTKFPVTFGNDDKSHQNKSHNEITVQLCKSGKIFGAKSEVHRININLGKMMANDWTIISNRFFFAFIYY